LNKLIFYFYLLVYHNKGVLHNCSPQIYFPETQEAKMSLSKIANNQKRKLVSDDGSTEEPWSKKQRQQLGLPALFQIFEGKMPRLGDEDEKSMDVAINIYGTAEEPIFLAADVRKLCNYEDSRIRKQVGLWEGKICILFCLGH
jgi:hypothetical protein